MDIDNWYICWLQLGSHPVAVVQYTFTHKQYREQHNSLIRNSADRAPSLRGIPWHLPYNWAKRSEKTSAVLPLLLTSGIRLFGSCLCPIYFCTFLLCIYFVVTKVLYKSNVLISAPDVVAWPQGATGSVSTMHAVLLWTDSVCNYYFGVAINTLRVKHLEISQQAKCEDQKNGLLILRAFICCSIRTNIPTVKCL